MRTKTLLLTAALGAAGVAASMAQDPVFSVNAVGYVNKDLTAGFNLIANPLSNGDNTLASIIPSPPPGTVVSKFNGTGFDNSVNVGGTWIPNASVAPGEGFFISLAADATITFIGEVAQGDASNMTVPMGLSLLGSLVPQAGNLSDDLGFPGGLGTVISVFTGDVSNPFENSPFITGLGFFPAIELEVGQGFFVTAPADVEWNRDFSVNN